jgi:hypothetical protein
MAQVRAPLYIPCPDDPPGQLIPTLPIGQSPLVLLNSLQPAANLLPVAPLYVPKPDDPPTTYIAILPNATPLTLLQIKQTPLTKNPVINFFEAAYPADDAPPAYIAILPNSSPLPLLNSLAQPQNPLTAANVVARQTQAPDDSPSWQPLNQLPDPSYVIQNLTQQKLFAQGGQVPTKQWQTPADESSVWQPLSNPAFALALTQDQQKQLQLHAQPSELYLFQKPATPDEASAWQHPATPSFALQLTLDQQKQLQLRQANSQASVGKALTPDDPGVWQPPLGALDPNELLQYREGVQVPTKQWHWDFDEASVWQWKPQLPNQLLTFNEGVQAAPRQWRLDYDESSVWQGKPTSSAVLSQLLTAGGQVKAFRWNYGIDEPPAWQPVAAPVNQPLTTPAVAATPFVNVVWRFNFDDPASWQPSAQRNDSLYPPTPVQNPFAPIPWRYNVDDPSNWQGKGVANQLLDQLTQQKLFGAGGQVPTKQWQTPPDDSSVWALLPQRNDILLQPTAVQNPFVPNVWRYQTDDLGAWQPQPQRNVALYPPSVLNPFIPSGWRFQTTDELAWQPQPLRNQPLLNQPLIVPPRWQFNADDAAFWQGKPLQPNPLLLTATPIIPPGWRFNVDEPLPSQPLPFRNSSLYPPTPPNPFVPNLWRFDHDDSSVWTGKGISSRIFGQLLSTKQVPTKQWEWHYDDASAWSYNFEINAVLTLVNLVLVANPGTYTISSSGASLVYVPVRAPVQAQVPPVGGFGALGGVTWPWQIDTEQKVEFKEYRLRVKPAKYKIKGTDVELVYNELEFDVDELVEIEEEDKELLHAATVISAKMSPASMLYNRVITAECGRFAAVGEATLRLRRRRR